MRVLQYMFSDLCKATMAVRRHVLGYIEILVKQSQFMEV